MHKKIESSSKRTDEVISQLPMPIQEPSPVAAEVEYVPEQLVGTTIIEKNEEDIIINTETTNDEHHFQKPDEQIQKQKKLTKKQLEKKFKEELQRVKDKSDNKK